MNPSSTIFNHKPEAEAVAEIAKKAFEPRTMSVSRGTPASASFVVLPAGTEARSVKALLDEYRDAPERRKGTATLLDLESFVGHVKRFADADSALFAVPEPSPKLVAVLDYHRAGGDAAPRFGAHRASYEFPLSEEWEAWQAQDGEQLSHAAFAEFLENRILDVLDPEGALASARVMANTLGCEYAGPSRLLELSRGIGVHVNSRVRSALNLSSGETQILYDTQHADESGQPLRVPGAFLVGLPVFRNGAVYQIPVRLRYRVSSGSVSWFFEMFRAERAFDNAFAEACEAAKTGTGLPLFMGSPEA